MFLRIAIFEDMKELKEQVLEANFELMRSGLVIYTWGNASAIDRERGLVAIKPSGVKYESLKAEDIVVLDLDGRVVEGKLKPSSDTATHLEIYKSFSCAGAVVHTHSTYATAWAQAGLDLPCLGTTHADCFHGPVPCTASLDPDAMAAAYEKETGMAIVRRFSRLDPATIPGVLVRNHGPFTWGKDTHSAVYNSVVLEEVAKMASITLALNPHAACPEDLQEIHLVRKHGPKASYGQ